MKKLFLLPLFLFLYCHPAHSQVYDIPCPSGTSVLNQSNNPTNGHLKAYFCIDGLGNVTSPYLATGGATPNLQHVSVAKNCPPITVNPAATCFNVALDTQLVSDATWSATSNVQITVTATDPQFQCPNGYPCSNCPTGPTCDIGKFGQAGANCRSPNPMQCDTSIPVGQITSIQSPTLATLNSTAATASNTGSGFRFFSWGTDDTAQLSAANDFCVKSITGCTLDLPCGRMFYSSTSFTRSRVTQTFPLKPVFYDGHHCAEFVVSQNFNCVDAQGCFLNLSYGAGQQPAGEDAWADGASGIIFFTFFDTPNAAQFPGTGTYRLIGSSTYTRSSDIWVIGAFWNIPTTKTVYGQTCVLCSLLDNNVSWASGNRGLYVSGAIQGTATILNGFYGNQINHSCDIDGGPNTVVALIGTQCNFPLSSNATENGAGLDTLSTFSGVLYTSGASIQGAYYLNGGTLHINDIHANPSGASQGFFVQNANVKLYLHGWHFAVNGGTWLHLSAGNVIDACGNSSLAGFTGANLATVTGGTWTPCSSSSRIPMPYPIGNITLTNWGTGAAASALAANSDSVSGQFTITAGTTPSANPTTAIAWLASYATTPNGCSAQMVGGTGTVTTLTTTALSASGVTFTFNGTPVNASTYIIYYRCL